MYCYPSVTGARNLLFLFLLIANASSVICAGAVWILFSNWKSLECDVCAQRWLNVALCSQKNLFLTLVHLWVQACKFPHICTTPY